ncbi:MAG: DszA family monooxygenase [Rhodoferax sp.]|nr:DszA family monooxygenase [Rhodoferax sp.]
MTAKKQILLNAFNMNCVGHINHGLWAHPRDESADYKRIAHWTGIAKTLERGLFDGFFIADIVGVYDVYQQNVDVTLREAIQLPVNDPMLLVSAMAAVTQHLGFGVTVNLGYELPYLLARRFSTLDHLTQGRIGWNIVTGYLDSAARAMGRSEQLAHDERYNRADEFLDVVYKLWEGSWEDGAVLRDKAARIYTDPARVHKVQHAGRYYQVDGYHLSEPSPQRTPVLFQAGSSGRGQHFAGRHAECVFISPPDKEAARRSVQSLRAQLVQAGRRPDDVKVFVGASVVTGATTREAQDKYADYKHYASREAGLAHFSASTGIDYGAYDLDAPVAYGKSNAIESATQVAEQRGWTRRSLLELFELGGRYPAIVGDAGQVADTLQGWIDDTGVDGFNLSRTVVPESYADMVDFLVPELQNRGVYKTAYADGTLRHKLFGEGDRLPGRHAGAQFRR